MSIIKCKNKKQIPLLIKKYKLDRRFKYDCFEGDLIIHGKALRDCSGCDGNGCHECGYQGKVFTYFPMPVFEKKFKGNIN